MNAFPTWNRLSFFFVSWTKTTSTIDWQLSLHEDLSPIFGLIILAIPLVASQREWKLMNRVGDFEESRFRCVVLKPRVTYAPAPAWRVRGRIAQNQSTTRTPIQRPIDRRGTLCLISPLNIGGQSNSRSGNCCRRRFILATDWQREIDEADSTNSAPRLRFLLWSYPIEFPSNVCRFI